MHIHINRKLANEIKRAMNPGEFYAVPFEMFYGTSDDFIRAVNHTPGLKVVHHTCDKVVVGRES